MGSAVVTALLALLVSACSQEVDLAGSGGNSKPASEEVPITIAATLEAGLQTRAGDEPLKNGSTMGVFRAADGDNYGAVYSALYTLTSGKWNALAPIYVSGKKASLCAYSPHNGASFESGTSTVLTLLAQRYAEANDVCYAKVDNNQTINNVTPNATFAMERAYSQLTLSLRRDPVYPLACKVTHVKLEMEDGGNLVESKKLDISTGNINETNNVPKTSLSYVTSGNMHDVGLARGVTDATFRLLLPAQALSNATDQKGLKLTLTIDEAPYSVTIPYGDLAEFKVSTNHVVHLKIKDGVAIKLGSVSTADWTDGAPQSGDASPIQ